MSSNRSDPISLVRPRRKFTMPIAVVGVVILVIGAIIVWSLMRGGWGSQAGPEEHDLPKVPDATGSEGVKPLLSALESYYDEHDAYPSSADDLAGSLERDDALQYRVHANADGSEYIAGVVGFEGDYAAFTSDSETTGFGASFDEALANSGYTADWAEEKKFPRMPTVEKSYGALHVAGGRIQKVTYDLTSPEYHASSTPVPKTAAGTSWQEAAQRAGADPAQLAVPDLADGKPVDVTSNDESFTARVLKDGETVTVRIEWAPAQKATGMVVEPLLEQISASDFGETNGSFRCASASDEAGMHQVVACQTNTGRAVAWSTTGQYGEGTMLPEALAIAGAGEQWSKDHDVILPTYDDLF